MVTMQREISIYEMSRNLKIYASIDFVLSAISLPVVTWNKWPMCLTRRLERKVDQWLPNGTYFFFFFALHPIPFSLLFPRFRHVRTPCNAKCNRKDDPTNVFTRDSRPSFSPPLPSFASSDVRAETRNVYIIYINDFCWFFSFQREPDRGDLQTADGAVQRRGHPQVRNHHEYILRRALRAILNPSCYTTSTHPTSEPPTRDIDRGGIVLARFDALF